MTNKICRIAVLLYLVCLLLVVALEVAQIDWAVETNNLAIFHAGTNEVHPSDFVRFYTAGKLASSSQRQELFNWQVQKSWFEKITNSQYQADQDFFVPHLPLVFFLMIPFAALPLATAHLVFIVLTTLFGVAALWLLIRTLGYDKSKMAIWIMLGILASDCCWRNWEQGQLMWFYVGLVALYLSFLLKKHDWKAGIALLIFSVIKLQYALYLAVPLLALKRYRVVYVALLMAAVLTVLWVLVFGLHSLLSYPELLHHYELTANSVRASAMCSIRAILNIFLSRAMSFQATCALYFICLSIIIKICFDLSKQIVERHLIIWLVTTCILASLVFSPHEHLHDTLLLAIPAVLTLPMSSVPQSVGARVSLALWRWLLFLFPILSWVCFFLLTSGLYGSVWQTIIIGTLFICACVQFAESIRLRPAPVS